MKEVSADAMKVDGLPHRGLRQSAVGDVDEMTMDDLYWRSGCSTFRSGLRPDTGWCEICFMREKAEESALRCDDEIDAILALGLRLAKKDAKRSQCKKPHRPKMRKADPDDPDDAERARVELFLADEGWDMTVAKRFLDAERHRLCRLRKKSGTSPYKKKTKG